MITAVKNSTLIDNVILATTTNSCDDELTSSGIRMGIRVFRGSENDVLGRFVGALEGENADIVIRQTADDPLLDPIVIDKVIKVFLHGDCDYASNILTRTWPRGLDTEVFSRNALDRTYSEGMLPEHREHVTIYMRTNPDKFRLRNVRAPKDETWPELRLCIDTKSDYDLLQEVFAALWASGVVLHIKDIIAWLKAHPEIASLNAKVEQKKVFGQTF